MPARGRGRVGSEHLQFMLSTKPVQLRWSTAEGKRSSSQPSQPQDAGGGARAWAGAVKAGRSCSFGLEKPRRGIWPPSRPKTPPVKRCTVILI